MRGVAKPAESLVVLFYALRASMLRAVAFVPSIQPASPLARSRFVQAPLTHTIINPRNNGSLQSKPIYVTVFSCTSSRRECTRAYPPPFVVVFSFANARTAPCAGAL